MMKGPGRRNELAKKAKKMTYPAQMSNKDYGGSSRVSVQRVDVCSSGSDKKCYGSRAIAMKEQPTMLQDLMMINELSNDDGDIPEMLVKEIKGNVTKGAKDTSQQWKDALELTHKAYQVSQVKLPKPAHAKGWKKYEDVIKHAVTQLAASRGLDGDWRITSQIQVAESMKFLKELFELADTKNEYPQYKAGAAISKSDLDDMATDKGLGSKRFYVTIAGMDEPQEINAKSMSDLISHITDKVHKSGMTVTVEHRADNHHGNKAVLAIWAKSKQEGGKPVKREQISIQEYSVPS